MEIELHPAVSLLPGTFNVLVAPVKMKMPGSQATLEVSHEILETKSKPGPIPAAQLQATGIGNCQAKLARGLPCTAR
jgi:hypothetical protein